MRITKIESLFCEKLPRLLLVRVHTDPGIIGLGETYDKVPGSLGTLPRHDCPHSPGRRPGTSTTIELLLRHHPLPRLCRGRTCAPFPPWRLPCGCLGKSLTRQSQTWRAVRDRISTYNTCIGHPPSDDFTASTPTRGNWPWRCTAEGIQGVKIWPFDKYSERNLGHSILARGDRGRSGTCAQYPRHGGPGFRIGVECPLHFSRAAIEQDLLHAEPYNISIEEVLRPTIRRSVA